MSISLTLPFSPTTARPIARAAAVSRTQPGSLSLHALAQGLLQSLFPRPATAPTQPARRQPVFAVPFVAAGAVPVSENGSRANFLKASSSKNSEPISPLSHTLRVVRVVERGQARSQVGRMVISGRMADVCAELDRLAACEAA
jgi:hypothetical protein